jgi:hypothetical protein
LIRYPRKSGGRHSDAVAADEGVRQHHVGNMVP